MSQHVSFPSTPFPFHTNVAPPAPLHPTRVWFFIILLVFLTHVFATHFAFHPLHVFVRVRGEHASSTQKGLFGQYHLFWGGVGADDTESGTCRQCPKLIPPKAI